MEFELRDGLRAGYFLFSTFDVGRWMFDVRGMRRAGNVAEMLRGGWFGRVKECEHRTSNIEH